MKHSISPVVRIAVEPMSPSDLPKLVEGLKKLSRSDPSIECITEDTGEHFIAGNGEQHLLVGFGELVNEYARCEIKKSEFIVSFKETVTATSSQICMSKS
jgi:elongation factor 2